MASKLKIVSPDVQHLIKELRDLNPTKQNYDKTVLLFQQTFADRCSMRNKESTGSEIIRKYSKFMNYSGKLVNMLLGFNLLFFNLKYFQN